MTRKKKRKNKSSKNPLYDKVQAFLLTLTPTEREAFFSNQHVSPERRAELWMQQADLGEKLVNRYAWAIPSKECVKIFRHFSPIVEVACGANAYWCRFLQNHGVDIVGYDLHPTTGGKIGASVAGKSSVVRVGGPSVLEKEPTYHSKTLFLCYPDEMTDDVKVEGKEMTLGEACLYYFRGDTVIHVGELYGDTLSTEQAPWGRSSGPDFQIRLATEYHCVLQLPLPNWLHVRDCLTVWKRTERCEFVFEAEDGDEDDENETVSYRFIPKNEDLPLQRVAPKYAHLLSSTHSTNKGSVKRARKDSEGDQSTKSEPSPTIPIEYESVW